MPITFAGALAILLIGLKLTGHIAWTWFWVLFPLWTGLAVVFIIWFLIVLGTALAVCFNLKGA